MIIKQIKQFNIDLTLLQNIFNCRILMEGVGSQVIVALAFPVGVIVILIAVYFQNIKKFIQTQFSSEIRINQNQDEQQHRRHLVRDNVCCICLAEPKKFEVSATCGHSFCGECILDLFEHDHQKITCPLCRHDITTMFKLFNQSEPVQTVEKIQKKIRDYNCLFDDSRPFLRRVIEFPYVLRRVFMHLFKLQFLIFFLRSFHLIRFLFLAIVYLILPLDLLPQYALGIIGFIDDLLIFLFLLSLFSTVAVLEFRRHRRQV